METDAHHDAAGNGVAPAIYEQLEEATPDQRRDLVLQLIEEHPKGRLELPARDDMRAMLADVDFSPAALRERRRAALDVPPWWNDELNAPTLREADLRGASLRGANLKGVDLRGAALEGASLGNSNLQQARLDNADLRNADLADANLEGANLGEALLQGALLEQANLQRASLRFAELQRCALDEVNLQEADLWGAHLEEAVLVEANLQGVQLREAHLEAANLTNANLRRCDLRTARLENAILEGVDLREAEVAGASFRGAVLQRARLQAMVLTDCDVRHIHLSGAWLEKTRIHKEQLGGALGEELSENYEQAQAGYLALEKNFGDLGNPEASRWAYLRKRRMEKHQARKRTQEAFREGRWSDAAIRFSEYLRLLFVEWLCDYGESIPRTVGAIVMVYIVFTLIYGLTGSVRRVEGAISGESGIVHLWPLEDLVDVATFSLITMTAPEGPQVALHPASDIAHLFTSLQSLFTIVLAGLLGFVLGNRIHRR